jgi:peptidyl-prolyl cis-trans isomerase D
MISNLRNFAKTKIAKVFMVIIIIPFVFWGMGSVFSTGGTNSVAKINNYNISTQDLSNHFNNTTLDLDTIKQNIDNNVIEETLGNLISITLIQMEIEDLNINISDEILINKIKKNKAFLDDQNKFSRTKYEKFLLLNNMTAPDFENRLKKQELQNNLFTYIGGGLKTPYFITNNIFKEQTKKLDVEFINLINVYKKKESFSNDEIQTYINDNKDKLKNEHIDFSYLKLTPQNLAETDEYSELFFEKIDEIENKILNEVKFKDIISELKIQPTIKNNYIGNNKNDKTEEKIYQKRNEDKIQLIDENEFYVLYEISKINKILPNLDDENFRNKIRKILYEKSKYEYNFKMINDINKKNFSEGNFVNLSNDYSSTIEQIQLSSVDDTSKFDINSVKLMYALKESSFTLVSDDEQNIYLAKIIKSNQKNIVKNSDDYEKYNDEANRTMKNNMYSSYDYLLNKKYKVEINQKTLERVKNYYR